MSERIKRMMRKRMSGMRRLFEMTGIY